MLSPLPMPMEMALWDRLTIEEFGLSGAVLMENASRGALQVLLQKFSSLRGRSALVFAGPGNNGGDAFALARHLTQEGTQVQILHTKPLSTYTGDTALQIRLAQAMDISCAYLPEHDLDFGPAELIVDGLLGIGFQGSLRPDMEAWIRRINKLGRSAYILSLDIPSGLSVLTGKASPVAVRAQTTVTFEAPKLGLFLPDAHEFTGQVQTVKIGIPDHIKKAHPTAHMALTRELGQVLKPPQATGHKGSFGHVLVIGGSKGLAGAPLLAAQGAMRSGAGLVTIAGPQALSASYAAFPEIMTLGLGLTQESGSTQSLGSSQDWSQTCALELAEHLDRFQAIVLGPGLGRTQGAYEFLVQFLSQPRPPLVLDADALFHVAGESDLLARLTDQDVLTPHPGELGRFFGVGAEQINAARFEYAQQFIAQHPSVLVLKGAGTLVAQTEQPLAISPFSAPNLAVAGSGDVLAGILGSLISQGYPALTAAQVAVYWHGLAGTTLARDFPYRGNTPLEIAHILPQALKECSDAYS